MAGDVFEKIAKIRFPQMLRKSLVALVISSFLLSTLHCTSSETVKPRYVGVYQGKDVVVSLRNGERIEFKANDYTIMERFGEKYLKGKGVVITRDRLKQFDDEIGFDEIAEIEVYEYSPIKTALLATGVVVIVFFIKALPVKFH